MKKRYILGLTGPTGAGKSTAAAAFLQLGWSIVDADKISRQVVESAPDCLSALAAEFGADILEEGRLNRKKLASKAFATPEGGKRLNAITHPLILQEIRRRIDECFQNGSEVVVLDAPLLFESKADEMCHRVLGVLAPEAQRRARIMERDGISEEAARQRMQAQPQEAFYREKCHDILENNAGIEELFASALAYGSKLTEGRLQGE